MNPSYHHRIFSQPEVSEQFNEVCLELFHFQVENNPLYAAWVQQLSRPNPEIFTEIPFLPISFFKKNKVLATTSDPEVTFASSTTTGGTPGLHHVADANLYRRSFTEGFKLMVDKPEDLIIMGLLPGYLERNNSSLVFMVRELMALTGDSRSAFFSNPADIVIPLRHADESGKKVLLIGVSFALLQLVELKCFSLGNTRIMETGGMKGNRKELTRAELHDQLCMGFGVAEIFSEYGMTELLSQAYSSSKGLFRCPPWMRVLIRQTTDPLSFEPFGKTGGINIIDLANVYSCPFIATDDLGKLHTNGSFEVLGRFDQSEVRGCNLMAG